MQFKSVMHKPGMHEIMKTYLISIGKKFIQVLSTNAAFYELYKDEHTSHGMKCIEYQITKILTATVVIHKLFRYNAVE